MDSIPLSLLAVLLFVLILLSAFFSGSETALMSINRYRLRYLAKAGHRGAVYASRLLRKPDRLIGLILLGNNFVNILASSLATLIALRLLGENSNLGFSTETALAAATGILTLTILIFAETAPKTLAALHPERLAFPAAYVYYFILKVLVPIRWLVKGINIIANAWLRILGVSQEQAAAHSISREELQTIVHEAGAMIPKRHQRMLLNILDLEQVTVEDIMIPRNEIAGIDFSDEWDEIVGQIQHINHARIPVYRESVDNIVGILNLKKVLRLLADKQLNRNNFEKAIETAYFIPEGTSLTKQLLNFQKEKKRIGLVVDEYGDIQGLVSLVDILEEIVGEFDTDSHFYTQEIQAQKDGSYLVDASIHIREINKALNWALPTDGPKTLNGMILEYLEMIPEPGTSLKLNDYPLEVVKTLNNTVKTVRVLPVRRTRSKAIS